MRAKKKILILGKLPPPYMGPSIATEILLKSDLKNRFNLIHLDTKINDSISSFGKWSISKLFKNVGLYINLFKLLSKHKIDIVLIPISQTTTGFIKDSLFIIIASLFRTKIIIQLRGSDIKNWLSKSSVFTRLYFKTITKLTKGVIVLGKKLKYLFTEYYKNENIYVVPNGGNYEFLKIDKTNRSTIKILYFANLLESKGVEDVFKAVSILKKGNIKQPFTVDFVGAWNKNDVKERCIKLMQSENLPIMIHEPKSGEDKISFLSEADIFVFPPQEPEGHPWSIIEAMAASLPIISTDKGAITESVFDNENGFIVEAKNPEMIAEKLKILIENSELRKKMSDKSRELYQSFFTEETMVNNYSNVFNNIS